MDTPTQALRMSAQIRVDVTLSVSTYSGSTLPVFSRIARCHYDYEYASAENRLRTLFDLSTASIKAVARLEYRRLASSEMIST